MEEATQLGFPAVRFQIKVHASWWHDSFYAGLRHFHEEKGFHPASQDVARHLGYPLFEMYNPPAPFAFSAAHLTISSVLQINLRFVVEEEDSDVENDEDGDVSCTGFRS
jgi:hypothetical protein